MFEGCTIKYNAFDGVNQSVQITYPANADGIVFSSSVPINEENTDYQNILAWVAEGNTIQEAESVSYTHLTLPTKA